MTWGQTMAKRSTFERKANDFYPTPHEAVLPLLPHLAPDSVYAEPCAGQGDLVKHLKQYGHFCDFYTDIDEQSPCPVMDAFDLREHHVKHPGS